MRIEIIQRNDGRGKYDFYKRIDAYILNLFEHNYEAEDDIIHLDDEDVLDLSIEHNITDDDIDKYGDVEKTYMEYKNGLPIFLYVLIECTLFRCGLNYIKTESIVEGYYKEFNRYDVSNSDTYKKIRLLGVPEDGLPDSKIKQMIEQGTEIEIE